MLFKRKANALTLVLLILASVLTGTQLTQNGARPLIAQGQTTKGTTVVDGNPDSNISIQSPENKTYYTNNITLNFTINTNGISPGSAPVASDFYVVGADLDYDASSLLNALQSTYFFGYPPSLSLFRIGNGGTPNLTHLSQGTANLTDLAQGSHHLTVWIVVNQNMLSYFNYIGSVYSTVYFTVDSIPPNLTVQSPQAQTYNSSDIPLNFTVDKPHSWVSYSLDNQINATIDGNTTLTGLNYGHHSLTLFANDSMGYAGATQTINFSVATSIEAPKEPFPTQLVVVVSVASIVIVAFAGAIVYLWKRKH